MKPEHLIFANNTEEMNHKLTQLFGKDMQFHYLIEGRKGGSVVRALHFGLGDLSSNLAEVKSIIYCLISSSLIGKDGSFTHGDMLT